jgi:hypothetical protein
MREKIQDGHVFVARGVGDRRELMKIRDYLTNVGRSSLPNYQKIEAGCPNFHRINRWDPRAYVGGCFHQFCYFPWNQDVFNLFDRFAPVYHMKNALSGLSCDRFLKAEPDDGCTARLAFQFYPKGLGGLNLHVDPVDYHQLTVPVMIMSRKGRDFDRGGAFVENSRGERLCLDDVCDIGDVVYFNAACRHGVENIDPGVEVDWLAFEGRWMLLFAVNKLFDNARVGNSLDLKRPSESAEPAAAR